MGEPYYWSLDIPGLSETDARKILRRVRRRRFGKFASAADPRDFWNVSMDRATVSTLLSALSAQRDRALLMGEKETGDSLIEDLQHWLAWSDTGSHPESD
jgi:hypothetical protein